jgi:hypothetical protein
VTRTSCPTTREAWPTPFPRTTRNDRLYAFKELVFISSLLSFLILTGGVSADDSDLAGRGEVGLADEDALGMGESDELAVYLQVGAVFLGLVLFEGYVEGTATLRNFAAKATD